MVSKYFHEITVRCLCAVALIGAYGCGSGTVRTGDKNAKTVATGGAGGENATGANKSLERCESPLGTVSVLEDRDSDWFLILTRDHRLQSTVPLLRLLIQQSNCFVVVERGRGMRNIMGERSLEQSGELREGSDFGKGQMVSADYGLTPSVVFAENTGGAGAAAGAILGSLGFGGGGGVKNREATTALLLYDNRSSVQVAAAEGSASNTDYGGLVGIVAPPVGAALGGYTNTPTGKMVSAAFLDAYNNLIRAVRNYKPQEVKGQGLGTGGKLRVQGARQK